VDGVDAAPPSVVFVLLFFAETIWDPSDVKAIAPTDKIRTKMVKIDIIWEFCIVFVGNVIVGFVL
jgi:hypothetical protein